MENSENIRNRYVRSMKYNNLFKKLKKNKLIRQQEILKEIERILKENHLI